MATTTTSGYEPMRSGDVVLFYVNRDGLPLSDRCNERMWKFCMEQYPKSKIVYLDLFTCPKDSQLFLCKHHQR